MSAQYIMLLWRNRPIKIVRHTINLIGNLSVFYAGYILASFLLDGRKLFTFIGQCNC